MAAAMSRKPGGLGRGAMSTTTSFATASGAVRAAIIAVLPPIECPTSIAGSAARAASVSITSAGHRRVIHAGCVRAGAVVAQVESEGAEPLREPALDAAEILRRAEQPVQQHQRRAASGLARGEDHARALRRTPLIPHPQHDLADMRAALHQRVRRRRLGQREGRVDHRRALPASSSGQTFARSAAAIAAFCAVCAGASSSR